MRNENIGSDTTLFDITSDQATVLVPWIPDAAPDTRTDAGAVSVTTYYTGVVTTTGSAITLADGLIKGQMKKIQFVTDVGDATLTIASPVSASLDVVTFADVGDTIELIWNGTAWRILAAYNCADGTSSPAIA